MIAIRTNFSSSAGIGHLARTYRLASALKKIKFECLFFLDQDHPFLNNFIIPFRYSFLYRKGNEFTDEESDAHLFLKYAMQHEIEAIVVDDYRLSMVWERITERLNCPLIVFDDRDTVHHKCSMIVDAKWTGPSTSERYNGKTPKKCVRLLGPKYVMLDASYVHFINKAIPPKTKIPMKIMLSLGGGGDITILRKLTEKLLEKAPNDINFLIQPVIGYFASNKGDIKSIAEKDPRVKPISHARSLYQYLKSTTLYIGSAGGTIYEIISMGIPAITFTLSQNQHNSLNHLEDLGHYFHLNKFGEKSYDKLVELAWSIILNINRIKFLYDSPKNLKIDGLGAERIVSVIKSLINNCKKIQLPTNVCVLDENKNKYTSYDFERIDDQHINRYLDARNLKTNLQNMTDTEKVDRLEHYLWWLKTERISFLLKKNGIPILYIWHLTKNVEGIKVLIGGWFVCSETCTGFDAVHALYQQLEITDKEFPSLPWVAVIRKSNKFVMSLNKRFGFKIMDKNHSLFKIAKTCFPAASYNTFNFYYR